MSPTNGQTLRVQKGGLDLETFEQILLGKDVPFTPVTTAEECLQRLNNDAARFIKVINDGLEEETRRKARESNEGWSEIDEKNKLGDPYTGTLADSEKVNPLVLAIAKSAFDYGDATTPEAKRAAKQAAIDMIRSTPAMLERLKRNAVTPPANTESA